MANSDSWKDKLTSQQYKVLRQAQTESPFSGKLLDCKEEGYYLCGACQNQLFSSQHKFNSGSGWPSFYQSLPKAVTEKSDHSHDMVRTEIICSNCQSHLGHLFVDAPQTPTNLRYCINSCALKFKNKDNQISDG